MKGVWLIIYESYIAWWWMSKSETLQKVQILDIEYFEEMKNIGMSF